MSASENGHALAPLVGHVVVLDLASPFVYIGKLVELHGDYLILESADAHDLRDSSKTREKYVRDAREIGLAVNRRRVWVSRREVVGISRIEDVVVE